MIKSLLKYLKDKIPLEFIVLLVNWLVIVGTFYWVRFVWSATHEPSTSTSDEPGIVFAVYGGFALIISDVIVIVLIAIGIILGALNLKRNGLKIGIVIILILHISTWFLREALYTLMDKGI